MGVWSHWITLNNSHRRSFQQHKANLVVGTEQFRSAERLFHAYAICIEDGDSQQRVAVFVSLGNKKRNMTHIIDKPKPKLRKAAQPPLSHPGAAPESDRAKKPPLTDPPAADEKLSPGDRVEGLGNFGKPTGEIGTVERTNEEDAVVKWDDDGRTRTHQPSLKKVYPATRLRSGL